MDPAVRDLIARLHACPVKYALSATGGGAAASGWLLSVPGASRTVLEVAVPYAERALAEYLGHTPASFCSAETARAMAERAHARAAWLAPGEPVAGVGCTASLRSDRPKRGDHHVHIAVQTSLHVRTHTLTLAKEARDREGEEDVVDRVLLNALAEAFALTERVQVPLLSEEEVQVETQTAGPLAEFLAGRLPVLCVEPDGMMRADAAPPKVLLPGSFDPVHDGHLALAAVAARLGGGPAAFELAVVNADKPPLGDEEVRRRLAQLAGRACAWLTRAPTFVEKARLFPGVVFALGADTAARVVAPRFYGDSAGRMAEALGELRARGCRFLVAGRATPDGAFLELGGIGVPAEFADLFSAIPAETFRLDVSSTALRDAKR
jgi:nicotinamide mononucleotide (NMN) deamidase PncC